MIQCVKLGKNYLQKHLKKELYMKENGLKVNVMAKENKYGLMDLFMKVIGLKENVVVKEN